MIVSKYLRFFMDSWVVIRYIKYRKEFLTYKQHLIICTHKRIVATVSSIHSFAFTESELAKLTFRYTRFQKVFHANLTLHLVFANNFPLFIMFFEGFFEVCIIMEENSSWCISTCNYSF